MSDQRTEIDNAPKAERLPSREERKVRLSNLTEKQKSLLGASGAGVAGVSLGVVAMSLMGAAESAAGGDVKPPVAPGGGMEVCEVIIHTDAPYADSVNDSMSFSEAFKAARAEVGAGGIFEWHGKLYNTYLKEEWTSMDKDERADFFASIDKDFMEGDENREAEILKIVNDETGSIDDIEDIVIIDNIDDPIEPENFGEIDIVESDDDGEIVIIDSEDNAFNDDSIHPDLDLPEYYDDDIILIDEI